jgi:hypothetical protein
MNWRVMQIAHGKLECEKHIDDAEGIVLENLEILSKATKFTTYKHPSENGYTINAVKSTQGSIFISAYNIGKEEYTYSDINDADFLTIDERNILEQVFAISRNNMSIQSINGTLFEIANIHLVQLFIVSTEYMDAVQKQTLQNEYYFERIIDNWYVLISN